MSIDWSRPFYFYYKSDGKPADYDFNGHPRKRGYEVLTTTRNHPSGRCVVFISSTGCIYTATMDGQEVRICDEHQCHPVKNIPETVEIDVWINVYEGGAFWVHRTRSSADAVNSAPQRIACINVKRTVEVGEGLNK